MSSLIVTGGSGFLGRYVVREAADSHDVLATYCQTPFSHPDAQTKKIDLTDPPFDDLREYNPDSIIHCAGLVDVDECERNPVRARELNVQMTANVTSLAAQTDAHLVYLSTDAVFDGTKAWWSEDDTPSPVNVYGRTKLSGEQTATQNHDTVTIVRTNFFGWTETGKQSLAEWMLETLRAGDELTGFEDVHFTPLYAGDLARYLLALLDKEYTGLVHLAGSERLSKLEFAHELADIFGYSPEPITPIQINDLDFDAPRGRDLSLDVSHAESLLETSLPDVRTGVERLRTEGSQ